MDSPSARRDSGCCWTTCNPGVVNGWVYLQPRAYLAPAGAKGPPPAPVLWLLTRLHPKMRDRIATSVSAFEDRRWREELARWDEIDRPAAVAAHRAIAAVDVAGLTDDELAAHLRRVRDHIEQMIELHHKYTAPAMWRPATSWPEHRSGRGLPRGRSWRCSVVRRRFPVVSPPTNSMLPAARSAAATLRRLCWRSHSIPNRCCAGSLPIRSPGLLSGRTWTRCDTGRSATTSAIRLPANYPLSWSRRCVRRRAVPRAGASARSGSIAGQGDRPTTVRNSMHVWPRPDSSIGYATSVACTPTAGRSGLRVGRSSRPGRGCSAAGCFSTRRMQWIWTWTSWFRC